MHTLSATGITTKNRLSSADAWLILVEIDYSALGGGIIRYTSDESVTIWGTTPQTYYVIAMAFGEVQENLQGGLPRIDLHMSNLDTNLNAALNAFGGLRGAIVTVYIVPSGNLAANTAELTEVFTIIETSADNTWVTFTLGFADPLGRRFPRDRYTASACRHVYNGPPTTGQGPFCGYTGAEPVGQTTCNRTLEHCQDRDNEVQFGGSPGVDEGIYQ